VIPASNAAQAAAALPIPVRLSAPLGANGATVVDGPEAAPVTVLLPYGTGAAMDSPFMAAMASGLAGAGWRVVRFEFSSMARMRETGRRRGPDRIPVLLYGCRP